MSVIEINSNNYEDEVIKSEKKVLVDFNAEWCGPCRMLRPIIEEVSNNNDSVKIASINVDNESSLAEKYNVSSIPCLVLLKNGKEIKRNVGLISKDEIEKFIGDE